MPDSKFRGGRSASRLSVSVYRGPFMMTKGVGEDAPREAWPRALSQYGASWASCFDGRSLLIQNLPSFVLRPGQYRPIPRRVKT